MQGAGYTVSHYPETVRWVGLGLNATGMWGDRRGTMYWLGLGLRCLEATRGPSRPYHIPVY